MDESQPVEARDQGRHDRQHQQYGAGRHKAKQGSIEWARKRVRSIQRTISRGGEIPPNVRNEMERELAAHKTTIADKGFQRRRSAMITKYHKIRFFDRKKASRLVKQLERKLEETTDDEERRKLQADLHIARVDEAYTLHHPHAEPYVSLYGKGGKATEESGGGKDRGDDGDDGGDGDGDNDAQKKTAIAKAALAAERPPMWKVVEETMEQGPEALGRLRERRSADGADEGGGERHQHRAKHPAVRRERMAVVIAKENRAKGEKKQGGEQQHAQSGANPGQLNRKERRRLMRESMAASAEKQDGGGFFDI